MGFKPVPESAEVLMEKLRQKDREGSRQAYCTDSATLCACTPKKICTFSGFVLWSSQSSFDRRWNKHFQKELWKRHTNSNHSRNYSLGNWDTGRLQGVKNPGACIPSLLMPAPPPPGSLVPLPQAHLWQQPDAPVPYPASLSYLQFSYTEDLIVL